VSKSTIDCHAFAEKLGSWLHEQGPEGDVVVSSRVRLARNVVAYPFISKLQPQPALELCDKLRAHVTALDLRDELVWVSIAEASPVLRLLLRERHLVSRELAPTADEHPPKPGRAVAFTRSEDASIMVNEEDHLRLQAMCPGLDLDRAYERAREIDVALEREVQYAYDPRYGYLTCCPTNVGTGLRASVMLHLPALGMVRSELEKVITAAQRTGLAVRGLYGEGSRAAGDFYQISNQVTLGRSEEQLIAELRELVPAIVRFERRLRDQLLEEQKAALTDRVSRSWGLLRTARSMPTDGALSHLSNLRLGRHLGLWSRASIEVLNRIRVQIQRGHVQALDQKAPSTELFEPSERDKKRAALLRRTLVGA
jgi:protein arginine kinase